MRALLQEGCRNQIQIRISVRRLREFRNLISGNTGEVKNVRWRRVIGSLRFVDGSMIMVSG